MHINIMIRHLSIIFIILSVVACGGRSKGDVSTADATVIALPDTLTKPLFTRYRSEKKALKVQYREWRGVPYQIGGMSKRGVDCSRFVHLAYIDQFSITLPTHTEEQVKIGKAIDRWQLQAGDLVFFRTSRGVNHVGIYISGGKFLHASTRHGVSFAHMQDHYWRKRYWTSRRIMDI